MNLFENLQTMNEYFNVNLNYRWDLLEKLIGIDGIEHKFNAYHSYKDENWSISKIERWFGWFNDSFEFVNIWPKTHDAKVKLQKIKEEFVKHGWTIDDRLVNNGIGLVYNTMTEDEVEKKAHNNLINGGRMSD